MVAQCSACGLPLREHEQGDGPAFFGIVVMGTLAALGASVVDVVYQPPYWLHALLWVPFIIIGSLLCLRYGKALLIHMQYRVKPWDFGQTPSS